MSLPTGTVTFLFTDIEGSTRLWQQFPDTMPRALARHHALLEQAITAHQGYVFQIVGDAFCAAFHTASKAIAAALTAQRALCGEPWETPTPIRVRMAIHTGTAEVQAGAHKSGEYVSGLTLSRVARLLSVAHGGQVLVSHAAEELVRDQLSSDIELLDLGMQRLRDLSRPEHVFQLAAPDLPRDYPVLRSLDVVPNNLPVQLTSFIGREREIAEVQRLLGGTHLLTITGPGGSGKTRLGLEAAATLIGDYPDGVWLLEFAPVSDGALVSQVLASALGVREEVTRPLASTLVDHLRHKQVLLVFDNCEHLVDTCAQLADALLRACPHIKLVASSREPLGVTGEVAFRVPSLSLPEPRHLPPVEQLMNYDAIRLFVDRASAVKRDFTVTAANAAAVAQICQRLDGIPLAIELAAARVRALSVQQITAHLDERFRLLTGGSRTALPRHQTLRGSIDWSYDLLSEAERALLRRLSVFAGGWTLGAGEAVGTGEGVDTEEVLDLLGRLVDKSLVLMDEQGGEARFRLLETIREYASAKLAEEANSRRVRDRHGEFYLRFAEAAEPELQGPQQAAWVKRLEVDHDNLRAALRWTLDGGKVPAALRLGGSLWMFWDIHGHAREARDWLDEILARAETLPASVLTPEYRRAYAKALDGAARMRERVSEHVKAFELRSRSLELWRELQDKRGIAETLNGLGDVTRYIGDRARARAFVEESLALFREISDRRGIAHALINLADLVNTDGDQARAKELFEESVPLFRAIEDKRGLSHALDNLGGILSLHGEYARAEALYQESLRLGEELDDKHAIATALRSLGGVAHRQRDHARAQRFFEDSVARFREMSDKVCLARSLIGLGLAAHDVGDHDRATSLGDEGLALIREAHAKGDLALRLHELGKAALVHAHTARARRLFAEALAVERELQDLAGVATSLEGLAGVAGVHGQASRMATLLGAADGLRRAHGLARSGPDRDAHELLVAGARARIDETTFEAAWSAGAVLTVDQVITYALEDPEKPAAPAAPGAPAGRPRSSSGGQPEQ